LKLIIATFDDLRAQRTIEGLGLYDLDDYRIKKNDIGVLLNSIDEFEYLIYWLRGNKITLMRKYKTRKINEENQD